MAVVGWFVVISLYHSPRWDVSIFCAVFQICSFIDELMNQQQHGIIMSSKVDRRRRIEVFLHLLKEQEECMRFEPYAFVALVDKVIVGQPRTLEFIFRNGRKYEYTMVD